MRSPWKLITGLVSRGNSDQSEEFTGEPSTVASPGAEEGDAASLPQHEESEHDASEHSISSQHTEKTAIEAPATKLDDSIQPTQQEALPATSDGTVVNDAEPVVATTIRLVTTDRLSLKAEISPTPALSAPQADARNAAPANTNDDSGTTTEQAGQFKRDATAASIPTAKSLEAKVEPIRKVKLNNKAEAVQASPNTPFASESVVLNTEINQLREQLAQKLRVQNDQLRRMLARYDEQ